MLNVALEIFDVAADLHHLARDVDALGTMRFSHTFATMDAPVGLTQLRNCPVVTDQKGTAVSAVVLILTVL